MGYSDGSDAITRVLMGKGRGSRGRDRFADALMLTLKTEEGAWAQVGRQLFAAERTGTGFSLGLQKGPSPDDADFSQIRHILDSLHPELSENKGVLFEATQSGAAAIGH